MGKIMSVLQMRSVYVSTAYLDAGHRGWTHLLLVDQSLTTEGALQKGRGASEVLPQLALS